ncbi:hypothetical protein V497_03041 [Pseudogymnoascus sp. VKM F-4516 (FW-969)]|nr:hypothetical protein V497_03041 [Pseudogymnoascus sp. VKM F-4516 (FW-969)]
MWPSGGPGNRVRTRKVRRAAAGGRRCGGGSGAGLSFSFYPPPRKAWEQGTRAMMIQLQTLREQYSTVLQSCTFLYGLCCYLSAKARALAASRDPNSPETTPRTLLRHPESHARVPGKAPSHS